MWPFSRTPRHPPYEYLNITSRPGAFRLVKLLPPLRALFRDTVCIQIITVDDVNAVAYDTLSYTWGVKPGDPPNRTILIETSHGRRELRIYGPLEIALKNIKADRPLFIDQICINQSDDVEKAHQVQLMHEIYAQCTRLLVWLGPGTRSSDAYFDCIRRVSKESTLSRISIPGKNNFLQVFDAVMDPSIPVTGSIQEDRDDVLELLTNYGDTFPLHGAVDALDRPWFRRLWTIQEVCLAPSVVFQCGSQSVCIDCLRIGILFYNIYNTHWVTNVKSAVPQYDVKRRDYINTLNQSPIRMFQERKAIHDRGVRQSLYDLVIKYNAGPGNPTIGSTLAEDRIFGLMGMADPHSIAGIRVNYDNTQKVYAEAAIILARENLDLLLYSQFPKRITGLPSWVPDWSMSLHLPHGYLRMESATSNAGGDERSAPSVDPGSGQLVVHGVFVDAILEIGRRQMTKDPDQLIVEEIDFGSVRSFFDEIDEFLAKSRVTEDLEMTAIRLGGFGLSGPTFEELYGDEATEYLKYLHRYAKIWGQKCIDTRNIAKSLHISRIVGTVGILPWYWNPASAMDYLQFWAKEPLKAFKKWTGAFGLFISDVVAISCVSATLYLTSKFFRLRRRFSSLRFHAPERGEVLRRVGLDTNRDELGQLGNYSDCLLRNINQKVYVTKTGYIGIGPCNMEPGDEVVVLFGLTSPLILRKFELPNGQKGWTYIGETYCEGIMNGETLNKEETSFKIA